MTQIHEQQLPNKHATAPDPLPPGLQCPACEVPVFLDADVYSCCICGGCWDVAEPYSGGFWREESVEFDAEKLSAGIHFYGYSSLATDRRRGRLRRLIVGGGSGEEKVCLDLDSGMLFSAVGCVAIVPRPIE